MPIYLDRLLTPKDSTYQNETMGADISLLEMLLIAQKTPLQTQSTA